MIKAGFYVSDTYINEVMPVESSLPMVGRMFIIIKSNSGKIQINFTLIKQSSSSTLLKKILTHIITINLGMSWMFSCT